MSIQVGISHAWCCLFIFSDFYLDSTNFLGFGFACRFGFSGGRLICHDRGEKEETFGCLDPRRQSSVDGD
ncbi:unnamed protein product [Linum tenue]|uniref:Uncharacterized protein n=1 Tax=Linum tenue TaxID=586396 RepID=A0AAV0KQC1_9ROSI|nr:unnamed protein product [Linum tenue]CAI0423570.1 unnamed protein product [Linum tenue]